MIGSSGSYFRLSSYFNFDYLQNIKLLAKVGIPSLQLQVVLLDSIWYLQSSSKESTLLEFKYLFHKIPVERVYHIWGDLIKHNTLNMLFWIWPQPGSNSVFFLYWSMIIILTNATSLAPLWCPHSPIPTLLTRFTPCFLCLLD